MRRCESSTTLKNLTLKNTLLKHKKCYNKRLTFTILNDNVNLRMTYHSSNSIKTDNTNHNKHRVTFLDTLKSTITTTANSSQCNNTQPSSPKQLLSQKNLFNKALTNKHVFFNKRSSLNIHNKTTYSTTPKESKLSLTSQDNLATPRNTSNILSNTTSFQTKSIKRLSSASKNKINFKERSEIRKVAGTYISNVSSYGSLFEVNPESLMQNKPHDKASQRNSNSKLTSLMKKTLYDILPSKLKYYYQTSSTFRDLLSNT